MTVIETSPAAHLVDLFATRKGGIRRLSDLLGVHRSVILRWISDGPRNTGGHVPVAYNIRILEAADAAGVDRAEVAKYLDEAVCPTCGRPFEPGQAGRHEHAA